MNILKTLGEKFRLARKEPKEFTLGYDLYAEMPDHMMKNPPSRCDWFEESIYAVPVCQQRHQFIRKCMNCLQKILTLEVRRP